MFAPGKPLHNDCSKQYEPLFFLLLIQQLIKPQEEKMFCLGALSMLIDMNSKLEAATGFEPAQSGFAVRPLTFRARRLGTCYAFIERTQLGVELEATPTGYNSPNE